MPASAIITAIIVGGILYGGFFFCVRIAMKKGHEDGQQGDGD